MVMGARVDVARLLAEPRVRQSAQEWLSTRQLPVSFADQGQALADLGAVPAVVDAGAMGAEWIALLAGTLMCAWAAWGAMRPAPLSEEANAAGQELAHGLLGRAVALLALAWSWGLLVTWESTGAFGVFTRAEWAGLAAPLVVLGLHQAGADPGALGAPARRNAGWVALAFVSALLLWVWSHGAAPGVGVRPF
ncbi:hypothetical protein DL240_04395 [Lujinxingia litoralis]|uniref:Uncharacterized protein n=2 Tax=Lujinxingia litoralis TaxID=2211119 RepID=A0A328C9Z2_9DELT|nr:hypothetical protein DL240_04395 [Lujinxingia litoralis]